MAALVEGGRVGIDDSGVVIDRHRQEMALAVPARPPLITLGGGRHLVAV